MDFEFIAVTAVAGSRGGVACSWGPCAVKIKLDQEDFRKAYGDPLP